jgi:hypothetical protein
MDCALMVKKSYVGIGMVSAVGDGMPFCCEFYSMELKN